MLGIAARHKYILNELNKNGTIRVTEMAEKLNVTKVTIRKDLKALENKGLLYRVHGSASSVNPHAADVNVNIKDQINSVAKHQIAIEAAKLIQENDSIMIGSGSTIHAFAEAIQPVQHLNVVTLSLKTAILLNEQDNIDVIQLGGKLNKNSMSVRGDYTVAGLQDLVCSKLFIGVDGIDPEYGITAATIEEAQLTQKLMAKSSKVIILADSSKFGKRGFGRICSIEDTDIIITDDSIPEQYISLIEGAGVDLIISSLPS